MLHSIGYRIYQDFKRPSLHLVELFRGIPSSNINDQMNRLYCINGSIHPLNRRPLLGCALTVKVPAGDNIMIHHAMDLAQPGDIIVIDGEGVVERSLLGEIMLTYATQKGIAGFVVDGAVRDVGSIEHAEIPVYAKAITPQGPYKNGPGEINVPISCGGQVIFPGDILVGDEDGIVVIRPEYAEEIALAARAYMENEESKLIPMRSGDISVLNHEAFCRNYLGSDLKTHDFWDRGSR